MILVDTAVWVDHLHVGTPALKQYLLEEQVFCHSFIIGELACGNIRTREEILRLLSRLPRAPLADHDEVLLMIDGQKLMGKGLGWIDAHLLASARICGSMLWTTDRRVNAAAKLLGIGLPKI